MVHHTYEAPLQVLPLQVYWYTTLPSTPYVYTALVAHEVFAKFVVSIRTNFIEIDKKVFVFFSEKKGENIYFFFL